MRVTTEMFQVGGGELSAPNDAAVYMINFGGYGALIDAGTGKATGHILENIKIFGLDPGNIEYLLITHCHFDHVGGVNAIREYAKCKVVAHELEAAFLETGDPVVTAASWYGATLEPIKIDIKLMGAKQDIELNGRLIEAIHTPGHSPGSVVYVTQSEGLKILFGQDVHGPLDSSLKSNRKDYIKSLELLISLEADILCEGHYGIIRGKESVKEFIQSFF